MTGISYERGGGLDPRELQALFGRAWGGPGKPGYDAVLERSFTWVAARSVATGALVGFVNVAWDGGVHFFLLDTTVDPDHQRQGIGTALVREAIAACAGEGEWMHVDSDAELMSSFYVPAGFHPANAGLLSLVRP